MSQGGYVTLIGFVAREPMERTTGNGTPVADVRIGTTPRLLDRETGKWRDGETSYYTVNCWRRMAGHVRASLRKGDPVVVKGKFRTRTFEDKQGRIRTEVEIVAETVGHDLSRGIANYQRPERARQDIDEELANGEMVRAGMDGRASGNPDDPGEEGSMAVTGAPPFADPGSGEQVDEEEAVDEFNRDLDRELAEDGQLAGGGLGAADLPRPVPAEPEEPIGTSLPL
jgi:single-strand DNA-binding protein